MNTKQKRIIGIQFNGSQKGKCPCLLTLMVSDVSGGPTSSIPKLLGHTHTKREREKFD